MARILLILTIALSLYGKTPNIYSGIGDSVYGSVEAVRMYTTYSTFKNERALFSAYVREAMAAENEGFWLDKHRQAPQAKARSASYLQTLRGLEKRNRQIALIVKETTLDAIKKKHIKTYIALKEAQHPVFRTDNELRQAMAAFDRSIGQEADREKPLSPAEKKAYLRSNANLKGTWKGTEPSGTALRYHFTDPDRLEIVRGTKQKARHMEGEWKIEGDTMHLSVESITNHDTNGIPHTRSTKVPLTFDIREIGKNRMMLFDQRRKETIELHR